MKRIVSWFSCGTASAVTAKMVLAEYSETHEVVVARCVVPEEEADNDRFSDDVGKWLGVPILALKSEEFASCEDVPDIFDARAALSRELGARLVKGTAGDRDRIFLDELDPDAGSGEQEPAMECSLLCYMAEESIK